MNRRVFIALAVAALAFSTSTASAGGGSSKTQYVRIKNIGAKAVKVAAWNEGTSEPASRTLSQNGVAQFILKKGPGIFAVDADGAISDTGLNYNFPNSTYVYLQAKAVGDQVYASFAPPGTRF